MDYALDLKNFQEQSHDKLIVPVLLATDAPSHSFVLEKYPDGLFRAVCTNKTDFSSVLQRIIAEVSSGPEIIAKSWLDSIYSPTPTIVEAAQALYQGHNVTEISRSEAGAENLTRTAEAIENIITRSRRHRGQVDLLCYRSPRGQEKTLAGPQHRQLVA